MPFHLLETNCFSVIYKNMVGSTHHSASRPRKILFSRHSLFWRNLRLESALTADSLLLKQSLGAISICQPNQVDYSHPINYLEEQMKIHSHIFNQSGTSVSFWPLESSWPRGKMYMGHSAFVQPFSGPGLAHPGKQLCPWKECSSPLAILLPRWSCSSGCSDARMLVELCLLIAKVNVY